MSAHLLDIDDFELLQRKAEQLVQMYKPTQVPSIALSHTAHPPIEERKEDLNEETIKTENEHSLQKVETKPTHSQKRLQMIKI